MCHCLHNIYFLFIFLSCNNFTLIETHSGIWKRFLYILKLSIMHINKWLLIQVRGVLMWVNKHCISAYSSLKWVLCAWWVLSRKVFIKRHKSNVVLFNSKKSYLCTDYFRRKVNKTPGENSHNKCFKLDQTKMIVNK